MPCELCQRHGGELLVRMDRLRVVLVDEIRHPGFCRVIWHTHVREMTDLSLADRTELMNVIWHVEAAIREIMQPEKINLASLGNMVPHLHWHIIPRFTDDAQFPAPIWAEAKRVTAPDVMAARRSLLPSLRESILKRLGHLA